MFTLGTISNGGPLVYSNKISQYKIYDVFLSSSIHALSWASCSRETYRMNGKKQQKIYRWKHVATNIMSTYRLPLEVKK